MVSGLQNRADALPRRGVTGLFGQGLKIEKGVQDPSLSQGHRQVQVSVAGVTVQERTAIVVESHDFGRHLSRVLPDAEEAAAGIVVRHGVVGLSTAYRKSDNPSYAPEHSAECI